MAGPMNIFPALGTPLDLTGIGDLWRQDRHPVYNALGEKVGSYDTLDALCQGKWYVFAGKVQPPPSQLYVTDFWGRKVPLSTRCVAAAKATAKGGSIVQPQPVQTTSAAKAVADANRAATGNPAPAIDLDYISGPLPALGVPRDLAKYAPYAVAGSFALVGLALLFSDGGGRRRRR